MFFHCSLIFLPCLRTPALAWPFSNVNHIPQLHPAQQPPVPTFALSRKSNFLPHWLLCPCCPHHRLACHLPFVPQTCRACSCLLGVARPVASMHLCLTRSMAGSLFSPRSQLTNHLREASFDHVSDALLSPSAALLPFYIAHSIVGVQSTVGVYLSVWCLVCSSTAKQAFTICSPPYLQL